MTPADFRAALTRLGLSQAEAARRIGVTSMAVAHWLAGRRPVPKYAVALLNSWSNQQGG
jgi:transcriptional regulator with XRE-family HTH domain